MRPVGCAGDEVRAGRSPYAGRDGNKLTARQIQARLDQELIGNVSIRVLDTERPDTWEVQGRGELQLGVLVETLREPRLPPALLPADWPGPELRAAIGRYSAAVVPRFVPYVAALAGG